MYVQNPLFAPASQQQREQQGDDFDFNKILAKYFIDDFDDSVSAYTSSMSDYSGGVIDMETTEEPQSQPKQLAQSHTPAQQLQAQPPLAQLQAQPPAQPQAQPPLGQLLAQMQVQPTVQPQQFGSATPGGVNTQFRGWAQTQQQQQMQSMLKKPRHESAWGGNMEGSRGHAGISKQAIAKHRQKNREHAKQSRVRKKFMLESWQEQVQQLQLENKGLRLLIQEQIPDKAQDIIAECCSKNPLFVDPENKEEREDVKLVGTDLTLMESLSTSQQNFVLSDPRLTDNPIVFASPGFYKMTGYTPKEVLGRNCRFLQGPGTDTKSLDSIRKAISIGADCTVCLLNYKADGTPFWNQFFVAALRDVDDKIVNYVGVQCEVKPEIGVNSLEEKVNEALPLPSKDE